MKDDYNLDELQQIIVRGHKFNIMPRYSYHYTDNDYEKFSLDYLDLLVEDGGVAIDIGSHYGIYSLLAAEKSSKVYAFEPVPENYEILKKNIKANKLDQKIVPINKAVSDTESEVEFNVTWASDSAGFYDHPNAEVIRKITVQTNSIDRELTNVKNVSFIKIDTEGHEIHVLDGLAKTLKRNKKAKLLIEYNPECLANAGCNSPELLKKIDELGYDIFALHEQARTMIKVDASMTEDEILEDQKYLNLLCLPKGSWQTMLFLSHNSNIGGAELALLEMVNDFIVSKEKFIIPYIIFPGEGPLVEKFKELPVPISVLAMRGWTGNEKLSQNEKHEKKIINANAVTEISKIINQFQPQVAYTNTSVVPWLAIAAKAFGLPHVWGVHEFGDLDHGLQYDYGYDTSFKLVDSLSSKVIVNSQAVAEHVGPYIDTKKIKMLYYGLNEPVVSKKTPKKVFSSSPKTIKLVISGRVMPSKGQIDAVKAVKALRERGYEAELMLLGALGSEEYVQEIKDYCKKHALSSYVHLIGHQDNPFDYVAMADIFLMCSRNEAFGRVTVEAMLLNKPVVGAASGGTKEIVQDGKTGYLYKPQDITDLANKIEAIITKKLAKKMGAQAKSYAQKQFYNNYHQEIYRCLNEAVSSELPYNGLYRDLLIGSYYEYNKRKTQVETYRKELDDFSKEYNKVYKAYHDLETQLKAIRNRKIVKIGSKVQRLRIKRGRHHE